MLLSLVVLMVTRRLEAKPPLLFAVQRSDVVSPALPGAVSSPSPVPIVPGWRALWSIPVGTTQGSAGAIGNGQIAVRGPLVVVASRGSKPGMPDDLDGVYVVNGNDQLPDDTARLVRHIPSPKTDFGEDAVGVALDGDFVVFGTDGGIVSKVRLDGVVAWETVDLPVGTRPGPPALVDLNGDGVRDALVPLVPMPSCQVRGDYPGARVKTSDCGADWGAAVAVALDGKSGRELWRLPRSAAQSTCKDPTLGVNADHMAIRCADGALFRYRLSDAVSAPIPDETPDFASDLSFVPQLEAAGLAEPRNLSYRLWASERELNLSLINALEGSPKSAHADTKSPGVVAIRFDGPVQSLPSIGDINGDGVWDVVIVAGGRLQAFSTGSHGEAARALWRGDDEASGALSKVDTLAAYASRQEPRDEQRWLALERGPAPGGAFEVVASRQRQELAQRIDTVGAMKREPVAFPREASPRAVSVVAEVECGDRYALNEGNLVVSFRSAWQRLPDAPWPVVGLACVDSDLILEQPRGGLVRLVAPLPWKWWALFAAGAILIGALITGWFVSRKMGDTLSQDTPEVRRVVISDAPRTRRRDAHPDQERLLSGLLNVLDNEDTRPPVTIALYGPWGSGKSSVMQMLRSELQGTRRYIDVWFNAWRFQREKELAPALLQSIVDEVGKQSDWVTRIAVLWHRVRTARLGDVVITAAVVFGGFLLLAISVRAIISTGSANVARGTLGTILSVLVLFGGAVHRVLFPLLKVFSVEPAQLLGSVDSKRRIRFVRAFASEFEQVSERLPRGTRLIVFIDDLDRCPPDRIVNVLETLSMLADTGCGLFVLAIDPVAVRRAIELAYRDMLELARRDDPAEADDFARLYLEKLITLGVNVPPIAASEIDPDARLSASGKGEGVWAWLRTRVLPKPPLLLVLLILASFSLVAARHGDLVNGALDTGAHWVLASETPTGTRPPVASTAEGEGSSLANTHPSDVPSRSSAEQAVGRAAVLFAPAPNQTAAHLLLGNIEREPIRGPVKSPALIEVVATNTPSAALRLSEIILRVVGGGAALAVCAILAVALAELRRRRRVRNSRPLSSDSDSFSRALKACKDQLPPHPRTVVRFTNLCRFLYPVVLESAERQIRQWEPHFFSALLARWLGAEVQATEQWLETELDLWIFRSPTTRSLPPTSGVRGIDASATDVGSAPRRGRVPF